MDTSVGKRRATLLASFLHFDLSFMLWVLLGALGIQLAEAARLSAAQKGLIVAVPILTGSLLRLPVGILADRVGARRVGLAMLAFLFLPLALAWRMTPSLASLLAIGAMLGTAGASFAVALPLASRWYPPARQGLALGVAAAGNSGIVATNLLAPRVALTFGTSSVFALAMIPLAVVAIAFAVLAHEPPAAAANRAPFGALFRERDAWWFCLFYAVTFGGYVGLGSFLPLFLRDQFHLAPITAGYFTAALAFLGSAARPVGGILADRVGGARLLSVLLAVIAAAYALLARGAALPASVAVLAGTMACLGLGNGAVFQLVPQRFGSRIGAVTGLVGAVGGVGGFLLPTTLGLAHQHTGSFGPGFVGLALAATVAAITLRVLVAPRGSWRAHVEAPSAETVHAEPAE